MNENASNPGKGLGTGGFVLSLVAIVGYFIVAVMATASAALSGSSSMLLIWAVICGIALLLSFMGYRKSAAAGAKKGLATAGIVISLVALVLSGYGHYSLNKAMSDPAFQKAREEMKDALDQGFDKMKEDMKNASDSLENEQ